MPRTFIGAIALLAGVTSASAAVSPAMTRRLDAAARTVQALRADIPENYWTSARCIAVIPDLKKAAFIVGGEYGKGVMSCRAGDGWSAPVFIEMAKGSWGFQAGVEQVDLVLLVMNESGVQKLLQNKTTIGADASAAAGPVGRRGAVGTDVQLSTEIVSYSRSQGLFAGVDLSGGVLRPDEDANAEAYGRGAEPRTVLASRELSAPTEAREFLRALTSTSPAAAPATTAAATTSTPPAASKPAAPRSTPMSTTDDDVRVRVVDIQQALDRLLADTTPSPIGTSGSTGTTNDASGATVVVERARLLQLRQQLDQLLAALNRR